MNDDELALELGTPAAPPPGAGAAPLPAGGPAAHPDDALAADLATPAEHGFWEHAQTFAEGAAQGATLGAFGLAMSAAARSGMGVDQFVPHDYDKNRRAREAAMPITSAGGNVFGAVAPALLSGGTSLAVEGAAGGGSVLARVAGAMPSAIEANLGAKLAGALGEKAAAWMGGSVAAKLGARALVTGVESAADQAVRRVLDDAARGDVDITAERALGAAWDGFATGAALDLGLGALGVAGRAAKAGASKLAAHVAEKVGTISDAAGEAAYKAALGRTDIRSIRLAARHGGAAEVGKTLLSRGLVQAGDTVDDVAARLPAAREQAGQELRGLLDSVKDATTERAPVWSRIESEVLDPLDKPGSADVAAAVRAKLEASGIASALSDAGSTKARKMSLGELHQLRRTLDSRPDLKWGSAGPQAPDITTEAMRDVRRVIEDAFEGASDDAAKRAGVEGFGDKLKAAKRAYAHLATAADVAEQGAFARASRNRLGLNDTLAGVAGAAAMGPVGALGALGSKLIRERSESTMAAALYGLAQRQQARTTLQHLGEGALRTEQAITRTAGDAVRHVFGEPTKVAVASELAGAAAVQRVMERAAAIQRPDSPDGAAFAQHVQSIAAEDPMLANAVEQKVLARAKFLAGKLPPAMDASDPLGRTPGALDAMTARRNARYVQAAVDPEGALKRLSAGQGSAEDLETLRALTPRLYGRYVEQVAEHVGKSKRAPTVRERRRLAYVTGAPMDRADDPDTARWLQSLTVPPPSLAPVGKPQAQSPGGSEAAEGRYASRADTLLSGE